MAYITESSEFSVPTPEITTVCPEEIHMINFWTYVAGCMIGGAIYLVLGTKFIELPMFPATEYVTDYHWALRRIYYELQEGKEPLLDKYTDMNLIAIELLKQNRFICKPTPIALPRVGNAGQMSQPGAEAKEKVQ
ncbi:unnamed protein product [Bursaphelenchus xylophilus]|uniref:(pine wood nematode) hypothetical protein n=1 Tax=Bursaphelenchus xylophilus TaxID=6326 RepID=A0A1I7RYI8_BURXY|nr:unnamed protein product [Bursaphelenchus xylophilus]CAG9092638.1 unnamed protein product [Bursaphelenchus xylophilus]